MGDTVTTVENESNIQLPGYRQLNPMVYCGLYPVDNARYKDLREALEKMKLSDSSLMFDPETSQALGLDLDVVFRLVAYGCYSRTLRKRI